MEVDPDKPVGRAGRAGRAVACRLPGARVVFLDLYGSTEGV
jgi:hypothetical protein